MLQTLEDTGDMSPLPSTFVTKQFWGASRKSKVYGRGLTILDEIVYFVPAFVVQYWFKNAFQTLWAFRHKTLNLRSQLRIPVS